MIIPLDKLFLLNDNKYIFTRAAMLTVEKIGNIKAYPEDDKSWKVVPNILNLILNGKVKYHYNILEN
ncbi:MAG: hypothetical protein MUD12_03515 [Spirochaetes bacterium]|jgi:hypothetical protein|nr:hypothetical protein [Spirochaetota bacterium]